MAKGNVVANHWTLEIMECMSEDSVLEIGVGNGQIWLNTMDVFRNRIWFVMDSLKWRGSLASL